MIRKLGIVFIFIGVIATVLGFTGILPYIVPSGISLFLLGGLFLGLSFVSKPDTADVIPMSFSERITKIFYAPSELFKNLKFHPRWILAVLLVAIISGAYNAAFVTRVTPERITNHTVDKLTKSGLMNKDATERVREDVLKTISSPFSLGGKFISSFVETSFLVCFLGAVFLLIILALGGRINYWQASSVAAYSMLPVTITQKLTSFLILYLIDPIDIHPILGQEGLLQDNLSFLVQPETNPVFFALLSYLSLLGFYWLWLVSIGLHKAGERVSFSVGWITGLTVWSLGLILNLIYALLFGI